MKNYLSKQKKNQRIHHRNLLKVKLKLVVPQAEDKVIPDLKKKKKTHSPGILNIKEQEKSKIYEL